MRALLDTNVLVSFLLQGKGSTIPRLRKLWEEGVFEIALSVEVWAELARVLALPKIARRCRLDAITTRAFLQLLKTSTRFESVPVAKVYRQLRDPKDAQVLAAAEHFRPDAIVTGDRDLLALEEFEGNPILSPRQFLDLLSS